MTVILWHLLSLVLFHYAFADDESEEFFEVYMTCPANNFLLRGFGSRSPFFGDAIASMCTNMMGDVCSEQETSYTYTSPDNGLTVDAQCPDENEVIKSIKLNIANAHVHSITIMCCPLKDAGIKKDSFEESSVDRQNSLVDCGDEAAMQQISLSDAGNGMVTSVKLGCIRMIQDEEPLPL